MNREVLESIKHKQSRNIIIIGNLRLGDLNHGIILGIIFTLCQVFMQGCQGARNSPYAHPPPPPKEGIEIFWGEEKVSETKQLKVVNDD